MGNSIFGLIIMVLALLGPQIVKALSSIAEQKKAEEARRAGKRPAADAAVDLRDREEADRRQSLAEKRRAELEAWRARQVNTSKRKQSQTRVGAAPGPTVTAPAPARGGDLRAELAERRRAALEEIRRRQDIGAGSETSSAPTKPSAPRSPRPTARRATGPSIRGLRPPTAASGRRGLAPVGEEPTRQSVEPNQPRLAARRTPTAVVVPSSPNAGFRAMSLNQGSIRQAFLLKELFSAPVGLRDEADAPPGLRF